MCLSLSLRLSPVMSTFCLDTVVLVVYPCYSPSADANIGLPILTSRKREHARELSIFGRGLDALDKPDARKISEATASAS